MQRLGNPHAIQNMPQCRLSNPRIGIPQRAVLVLLILKNIRIDGSRSHAELLAQPLHFFNIFHTIRQVPLHVQRKGRTSAGGGMHLRRIAEFLFDRRRCRCLDELAEARARIRETPGRQLDLELVERLPRLFHQTVFHISPLHHLAEHATPSSRPNSITFRSSPSASPASARSDSRARQSLRRNSRRPIPSLPAESQNFQSLYIRSARRLLPGPTSPPSAG